MTKVGATVRPMLSKLLGLEVGPEEGLNEPVGKSEATKVGATLGPTLGIPRLGLKLGPEEGFEDKSEATKVGPTLGPVLGILLRLEVSP
jgi:hypothetical protein